MRRSARYLISCFLLSSLSAQMVPESGGADFSEKWALQLKMPDLITTTPDWNGDIGSVYFSRKVSPRAALRMGAGFMIHKRYKPHTIWGPDDITGIKIFDVPTRLKEVTFHVHALGYAPPSGKATLFFGFGPMYAISREHREYTHYGWVTNTMWSLGMEGVLGLLVQLKPRISVMVEYQFIYATRFHKQTSSYHDKVHVWTYTETVRQVAPLSPFPQLGISFQFK